MTYVKPVWLSFPLLSNPSPFFFTLANCLLVDADKVLVAHRTFNKSFINEAWIWHGKVWQTYIFSVLREGWQPIVVLNASVLPITSLRTSRTHLPAFVDNAHCYCWRTKAVVIIVFADVAVTNTVIAHVKVTEPSADIIFIFFILAFSIRQEPQTCI